MCTRARPSEGLGGAALEDGVLQMVSEPTLRLRVRVSVRANGAGHVWARMGHTAWHMMPALDVRACAKRGRSWTFAQCG